MIFLINNRERNKEICADCRQVASIPVIVEPVVVPVPLAIIVPIQIENVAIAIRIAKNCIKCLPNHHSLNTLGVESNS